LIPCVRCFRDVEGDVGLYVGEAWEPPDIIVTSYATVDSLPFCVPCSLWRAGGLFVEVRNAPAKIDNALDFAAKYIVGGRKSAEKLLAEILDAWEDLGLR